jgi:hypothetical protein
VLSELAPQRLQATQQLGSARLLQQWAVAGGWWWGCTPGPAEAKPSGQERWAMH